MSKTRQQGNSEGGPAERSRRDFLGRSATAALVGTAVGAGALSSAGLAATQTPQTKAAPRGSMIEYKSGDKMIPAYFVAAEKKNAPAVLVIHEVFGLNDHIKSIADRLSSQGFNALAPDLFVRAPEPPPKDSTDMAAIRKAASSITNDIAIKDMQAGLDYLKTAKNVKKRFGSVGFCMGGGFSYQIATHTKDLAGAAIFYGRTPVELVPQVSCPLLGSFGELDQGIPPEKLKEFEEALKKAGKTADIKIYPGAKHGFFNDTRPGAYNAEAA
ncbi:MAG TPA: dienelactone hydrolase family protein, partial [Pyrinomonadaceae bacterium]